MNVLASGKHLVTDAVSGVPSTSLGAVVVSDYTNYDPERLLHTTTVEKAQPRKILAIP
jgi:hypothetical protein